MKILRHKTRVIKIGNVKIGGNHPIAIQSMTKTRTADIQETLKQIKGLENEGCEIVRLAVKDTSDTKALQEIKKKARIAIVADIHFNWRLAIEAIESGVDKIRLNPGNIYKKEQIREIACAAKLNSIPIRVGINSGSIRAKSKEQRAKSIADTMVKETLDYIKILEGFKFYNIVVSLKGSNTLDTIEAYRKMAGFCDYPFHLGVTATGTESLGTIKSSIVLGKLLSEGIGDTIRVSLTDSPEQEVRVAKGILLALGLRHFGPEIISCPTCGRCEVDLVSLVRKMEDSLSRSTGKQVNRQTGRPLRVAIMGCVVNGPGEARGVDLGVAFGKKEGLLFKSGKPIRKVTFSNCAEILLKEMKEINGQGD